MKTSIALKISSSLRSLRIEDGNFETRQADRELKRLVVRVKKATQRMKRRSFLSEKF